MKTLGVFLTTYIGNGRHGGEQFSHDLWKRFSTIVIPNYLKYDPGIDIDINIFDTGSTYPGYNTLISSLEENTSFKYTKIPNIGGCSASIKYVMHSKPEIMDEYEYFFFTVDDTVYIEGDNWAKELVGEFNDAYYLGLMGRNVITLRMGPDGFTDHKNICPQIPKIWGSTKIEPVAVTHQDWWLLNRETLKDLSKIWYDPIHSQEAMDYIVKYENMDFQQLYRLGNPMFRNYHVGRELDTPIRINRILGKNIAGYARLKGEKVLANRRVF